MATSAPTELEFTGRESTVDVLKTMTKQLVDNTHAMKELKDKLLLESQTKVSFERGELVNVQVKVTFLKIGMIDFVRNLYEADVFIESRWPDPAMSSLKPEDLKLLQWKYFWDPKLVISNIVGSPLRDKSWNTTNLNTGELLVTHKRHLRAVFRAEFDLADFPGDVQELPLLISSERSEREVQLSPDTHAHDDDDENITRPIKSTEKEWFIFDTPQFEKVTEKSLDAKHQNSEELKASCFVGREMKYYCTNVIVYIVLIQLLSFTSLGVSETQTTSRDMTGAARLIVIFLNIIILFIFKYVAFVKLPYVKSITYLDVYMLGSFLFLCGFTLPGALYGITTDNDLDWEFEAWGVRTGYTGLCMIVMFAVFVLYNVVFWLFFTFKACEKRRILGKQVEQAKKRSNREAKEQLDDGKERKPKEKKKDKKTKKDKKKKDEEITVEIEEEKPEKSGLIELETSGV